MHRNDHINMKPVTNILLVLALVCYVFLPFYDVTFQGHVTGFTYTAGTITRTMSFKGITFALLPFLAGFFALGFNCLKTKYWSICAAICILAAFWFFHSASNFHEFGLLHQPDVLPDNDVGEGFPVDGLGVGYYLSLVLFALSFISALVSLMPFKFNETIERAVDGTFDKGVKAIEGGVRDEWHRIETRTREHAARHHHKPKQETPQEQPTQPEPQKEEEDNTTPPPL